MTLQKQKRPPAQQQAEAASIRCSLHTSAAVICAALAVGRQVLPLVGRHERDGWDRDLLASLGLCALLRLCLRAARSCLTLEIAVLSRLSWLTLCLSLQSKQVSVQEEVGAFKQMLGTVSLRKAQKLDYGLPDVAKGHSSTSLAQSERCTSSLSLPGACWLAGASRDARFSALSSSRTSRTIGSGLLRSSGRGRKLVRVAMLMGAPAGSLRERSRPGAWSASAGTSACVQADPAAHLYA